MGINVIISFTNNNFNFLVCILWDKNASFLGFGSLLLFPFSTKTDRKLKKKNPNLRIS